MSNAKAVEFEIILETFEPKVNEGSKNKIRVRPLKGQGYPTGTRVSCSTNVRTSYPKGTLFKVFAYYADTGGSRKRYLVAKLEPNKIISMEDADSFIRSNHVKLVALKPRTS